MVGSGTDLTQVREVNKVWTELKRSLLLPVSFDYNRSELREKGTVKRKKMGQSEGFNGKKILVRQAITWLGEIEGQFGDPFEDQEPDPQLIGPSRSEPFEGKERIDA